MRRTLTTALSLNQRCFVAITLATSADTLAALLLPERLPLTAEQFMVLCQANPNAVLEHDASGQLIHMTPPAVKRDSGTRPSEPCSGLPFAHQVCRSSCLTALRGSACPMAWC
jgi:hypothetical protein